MLMVLAPAKLNLTLEVLGRRPDGFHEVRSVLQTMNFGDRLSFRDARGVSLNCDMPGWSAELSLMAGAVRLLQKTAHPSRGVAIDVGKRIPLMSGLGGDSSDAAATLRGLNRLWQLGLPPERLRQLAALLGSDVAFFLGGGTALAEGRGELITPLPPLPRIWVVLVLPDVPKSPGKTRQMYASLKPGHYTDGQITEKLVETLKEGREFEPSLVFNTFENIAFDAFPNLKVYKEHLIKLGAPHVHLAGSGPTLFTMLKDRAPAEDLYMRCKNQGMESYLAETGEQ